LRRSRNRRSVVRISPGALRKPHTAGLSRFFVSRSGDIEVFSPEEVMALVRAAASEQDAALYLTAAFTGL
jgi:hypothetical protein